MTALQERLHQGSIKRINLVAEGSEGVTSCHYDTWSEFVPKLREFNERGNFHLIYFT